MKQLRSKNIKFPISMQIALTFLGLLVLVIGVCIFLNTFFLEDYYIRNKHDVLKSAYSLLNESALEAQRDTSKLSTEIQRIRDVYNLNIIVLDESTSTVISSDKDANRMQKQLFENLFGKTADNHIYEKTDNYTVQVSSDVVDGNQYIEMWGILDNGFLFLARVAIESITDSVNIANRFLIIIGVIAGILSVLISFWASRIFSKPISELTEISERMRNLDFDAKYSGHAQNEIGILGENINNLSETLETTISELKTANNELERDLARKTEVDDMRKEFLSNVSHELKTPLALIQGYAEGLKLGINEDEESKEFYCDVIVDEANKMNNIVKKLLTLNQLEFGSEDINIERFDIVQLINAYLQSVDILIKSKDVKVTFPEYGQIYVWSDQFRVYDVFSNYFTNALNHVESVQGKRAEIDINITLLEKSVRISVFNTGIPIPEDSLPHIWEKFYKVDKARTREYGGSGVGLSIVKAIQESLNQPYGAENFNDGVEFYFEVAI